MKLSLTLKRILKLLQGKKTNPAQKAQTAFSTPSEYQEFKSKYLPYIAVITILSGITLTVYQLQLQQDIRQQAENQKLRLDLYDINRDGLIDLADYNIIISEMNQTGENLQSDINKDGIVDEKDLQLFNTNYK